MAPGGETGQGEGYLLGQGERRPVGKAESGGGGPSMEGESVVAAGPAAAAGFRLNDGR